MNEKPLNWLLHLLFPTKCMGCNDITLEKIPFCKKCMLEFTNLVGGECPSCKHDKTDCVCMGSRKSKFLFYYGSPLSKHIIASLKYRMTAEKADYFGKLLATQVPHNARLDAIVYPPRSSKNKRKYGYDQSEMLATALGKEVGVPCVCAIKRKTRYTKEQKLLSAEQRIKNVKGAFLIDQEKSIGLRNVILVDDVMTTGATVSECASLLRKSGVTRVYVITVAKTPKAIKAVFRRL